MTDAVTYPGKDLEAMSSAVNYRSWILQIFDGYLGARVVEVGAGVGSFSELLMERPLESLTLVEPSEKMYSALLTRLDELNSALRIQTHRALFWHVAEQIKSADRPDSIIYLNVLEHVSDDEAELAIANRTLTKGGRIFVFVPALSWLYGSFDRQIGHVRRYTMTGLVEKCERAGFRILEARYFDSLGIVPWWIRYRLFRSETMDPAAVRFYDDHIVPAAKRIESLIRPPIGKNILLVGEKD
jgi:SAM-dependent methyltransferase